MKRQYAPLVSKVFDVLPPTSLLIHYASSLFGKCGHSFHFPRINPQQKTTRRTKINLKLDPLYETLWDPYVRVRAQNCKHTPNEQERALIDEGFFCMYILASEVCYLWYTNENLWDQMKTTFAGETFSLDQPWLSISLGLMILQDVPRKWSAWTNIQKCPRMQYVVISWALFGQQPVIWGVILGSPIHKTA